MSALPAALCPNRLSELAILSGLIEIMPFLLYFSESETEKVMDDNIDQQGYPAASLHSRLILPLDTAGI
jgi:hypothetical protein